MYDISNTDKITSAELSTFDVTVIESLASKTTFWSPPTKTADEPFGITAPFTKYLVTPAELSVICTST